MKALYALGGMILIAPFIAISMIVEGLMLSVFWGWFISGPEAPFPGLPDLSIVDALGVSLVVNLFRASSSSRSSDKDDDSAMNPFWALVLRYAIVWTIALILHALQG